MCPYKKVLFENADYVSTGNTAWFSVSVEGRKPGRPSSTNPDGSKRKKRKSKKKVCWSIWFNVLSTSFPATDIKTFLSLKWVYYANWQKGEKFDIDIAYINLVNIYEISCFRHTKDAICYLSQLIQGVMTLLWRTLELSVTTAVQTATHNHRLHLHFLRVRGVLVARHYAGSPLPLDREPPLRTERSPLEITLCISYSSPVSR